MSGVPQAWFQLVEARSLLRSCVERPPELERGEQRFVRTADVWWVFDRTDARVARLQDIMSAHMAPLFQARSPSSDLRAAGVTVTVDMAIDAVLPHPSAGNGGNPDYLAILPTIRLEMGRAVA